MQGPLFACEAEYQCDGLDIHPRSMPVRCRAVLLVREAFYFFQLVLDKGNRSGLIHHTMNSENFSLLIRGTHAIHPTEICVRCYLVSGFCL